MRRTLAYSLLVYLLTLSPSQAHDVTTGCWVNPKVIDPDHYSSGRAERHPSVSIDPRVSKSSHFLLAFGLEGWEYQKEPRTDQQDRWLLHPSNMTVYRARNLTGSKHYLEAIAEFTKAIEAKSAEKKNIDLGLYITRAKLYRRIGNFNRAYADLQLVLKSLLNDKTQKPSWLVRDHKRKKSQIALELVHLKHFDEAEPIIKDLVSGETQLSKAYYLYLLGLVQDNQDKLDSAIESYLESASAFKSHVFTEAVDSCIDAANRIKNKKPGNEGLFSSKSLTPPANNKTYLLKILNELATSPTEINFQIINPLVRVNASQTTKTQIEGVKYISARRVAAKGRVISIRFNPMICSLQRSDCEQIIGSLKPHKQSKKLSRLHSDIYNVPSGTLLVSWQNRGFKALQSLNFYSKGIEYPLKLDPVKFGNCVIGIHESTKFLERLTRNRIKVGKLKEARKKLYEWKKKYNKDNAVVFGLVAETYAKEADFKSALDNLNKALYEVELDKLNNEYESRRNHLLFQKGKYLFAEKQYDKALESLEKGFPKKPNGDFYLLLYNIFVAKEDTSSALEYLQLAEKAFYENARIVKRDEVREMIKSLAKQ